jgi:hypothetical protein
LGRLLAEPGMARGMGDQARIIVRDRYSPTSLAADCTDAYARLVQGWSGRKQ